MKGFFVFILSVSFLSSMGQELLNSDQHEIVFRSVNVIPMDRERILPNQDVVVKAGKIMAIGKTRKVSYDKNAIVIEAKGKFLMPGLAEMHAHVPPVDDLEPMKEVLMLFAANGVTTIRGMLGHPKHLELRSKIQSGEILGPRFYTSGPSLNGNTVKTVESADKMVRDQKAAGYDFLKLHPGLTLENFNAIVKTANEVKIPFAGHVSFDVGVWRAIDAGYASIDHLDGFIEGIITGIEKMDEKQTGLFGIFVADKIDAARIPGLMKRLHDQRIGVVPTQSLAERWLSSEKTIEELSKAPEMIYVSADVAKEWAKRKYEMMSNPQNSAFSNKRFIELRRKLIHECQRNGVLLLLGSDAPQVYNVPGFSIHHELQYLVDAGLSPYEALKTGTTNAAQYFNRQDLGTIKAGNAADLVLLNGNPLNDIHQSSNIEGVMLGNHWLSKEYIAMELKKLEKQ